MTDWTIVVTAFGLVVLLTAWLPMLMKELPLSLPMACVGLGALGFSLPIAPDIAPDPAGSPVLTEHLTEIVVIVALMGAGLRLDAPLFSRQARATWRLLGIAMPLTIAALAVIGWGLLGLAWPTAILLAAALAPTDPVLASDVQVGPPGGGAEDEARFTLTAEAGLNDGLAFPFINLALVLAAAAAQGAEPDLAGWFAVDVVWQVAAGAAVGWAAGRGLGWLTFRLPNRARLSRTGDGFVALGITAVTYGVAELLGGYGFIAVFVAAVMFRSVERDNRYHETLHEFTEQLERLLMMVLLVLFGGALSSGGLLDGLGWTVIAFTALAICLVRPACGLVGLAGTGMNWPERGAVAFFGIRGVGSAYYLAHAVSEGSFEGEEIVWSALALTVLVSVLVHGALVTPVMRWLDRQRRT